MSTSSTSQPIEQADPMQDCASSVSRANSLHDDTLRHSREIWHSIISYKFGIIDYCAIGIWLVYITLQIYLYFSPPSPRLSQTNPNNEAGKFNTQEEYQQLLTSSALVEPTVSTKTYWEYQLVLIAISAGPIFIIERLARLESYYRHGQDQVHGLVLTKPVQDILVTAWCGFLLAYNVCTILRCASVFPSLSERQISVGAVSGILLAAFLYYKKFSESGLWAHCRESRKVIDKYCG